MVASCAPRAPYQIDEFVEQSGGAKFSHRKLIAKEMILDALEKRYE